MQPDNRRHGHLFINCTECGPRFTITRALPYDRPSTTMAGFPMCPACNREYDDPSDRRFHAQPVACPHCGPTLQFSIRQRDAWCDVADHYEAIGMASALLGRGGIVLLQGIGGFHLTCSATDHETVTELRRRKHRGAKPLAVMFPDERLLLEWCSADAEELACLRSPRAPILILEQRDHCPAAAAVAPDQHTIGAMLPYSPLHFALMREYGKPLVMTSANESDEPIIYNVDHAKQRMMHVADGMLSHNRAIHMFADDSIVRKLAGAMRVVRRARGYVPESVRAPARFGAPMLGFGADLKNTFALGRGDSVILSQHLGDLSGDQSLSAARFALDHFVKLYDMRVAVGACDLHPDYVSTRFAERWCGERDIPLLRVQHHHAHLAACLGEHGEYGPALGLILDGTGYGTDHTIWGGELLYGDLAEFTRIGNLEPVRMPGNEAAAREPWRMALAWLERAFGSQWSALDLPLLKHVGQDHGEQAAQMLLSAELNSRFVNTSSMGRLLDACAALAGFGTRLQFEGQAAMWLEGSLKFQRGTGYPMEIVAESGRLTLAAGGLFRELAHDVEHGVELSVLSYRVHEGLAQGWVELTRRAAEQIGCSTVALSGGCFQNRYLLERVKALLQTQGMRVLIPERIPMNDGGISFGQVCIANARVR